MFRSMTLPPWRPRGVTRSMSRWMCAMRRPWVPPSTAYARTGGRSPASYTARSLALHRRRLLVERRVRPTVLSPLWNVAGFALGAATALMGDKAAMACTVAVEETIEEHYAHQAAQLGDDEAGLRKTVEKFRDEELEHRDTALAAGAEQAPAYEALSAVIKTGSRLAIWLSTRI